VLGLESVKDAAGNIIQEAPLAAWANLRQRALDTAIAEINKKTDLNIVLESLERSRYRRGKTMLTLRLSPQRYRLVIQKEKRQLKPSSMDRTNYWASSRRSASKVSVRASPSRVGMSE
jgi:hypothetical protein